MRAGILLSTFLTLGTPLVAQQPASTPAANSVDVRSLAERPGLTIPREYLPP